MSHPCDGHACDHCYLCDVVGVCCATVPSAGAAQASCTDGNAFRDAVVQEAGDRAGLRQLMQLDSAARVATSSPALALVAGPPSLSNSFASTTDPELEVEHVFAPRRHQ